MVVKFSIPIEPIPQPRARVTRNGTYQPAKIRAYKAIIKKAALAAMNGNPPLTGEIHCSIRLYRKYKSTSRRFGDCDNLYKAITDAMNEAVYLDDSQITRCTVEKITAPYPHVEITIDSEFDKAATFKNTAQNAV